MVLLYYDTQMMEREDNFGDGYNQDMEDMWNEGLHMQERHSLGVLVVNVCGMCK